MPDPVAFEHHDALVRLGERALGGVAGVGEDLLVHPRLAVGSQLLERRRVAAALGEAVAAVAEGVRARGEPRCCATPWFRMGVTFVARTGLDCRPNDGTTEGLMERRDDA